MRVLNALVTKGQQKQAKILLFLSLRWDEGKEKGSDLIKKNISLER